MKRQKNQNVEQLHSPDGKKRGGADAASLGGPLVMQVVLGGCAAENRGADFVNTAIMCYNPIVLEYERKGREYV